MAEDDTRIKDLTPEADEPTQAPVEAEAAAEEAVADAAAPEAPAEEDVPAEEAAEPAAEPAAAEAGPEAAAEAEPEAAAEAEPVAEAPAEAEAQPAPAAEPKRKKRRLPRSQRPQRTRPKREHPAERKPIVRLEKPVHERGRSQERQGTVVSDAMDKTIVVKVDTIKAHRRYKKVVRRSTKFHAHDERNEAKAGDVVRIVETRPLSKQKRWRLAEILEVAK
jgi:small subunit ribosomal protein S17